jgi:hypothetical protein
MVVIRLKKAVLVFTGVSKGRELLINRGEIVFQPVTEKLICPHLTERNLQQGGWCVQ